MKLLFAVPCFFIVSALFHCCGQSSETPSSFAVQPNIHPLSSIINEKGTTIQTRFDPPAGFKRIEVEPNSFAAYLRNLPLKPAGSKVKYFDGSEKQEDVFEAVINMDVGNKNLQQCADAVMRLRAEYLYAHKLYDNIAFTLTNGFEANYTNWINGNRIKLNGNNTSWYKSTGFSNSYGSFRSYLDFIFTYAGTLSLSRSLSPKNILDIEIGDVFIKGGSPGHAVIVMDVVVNDSGKKKFLVSQSYMPAQEIHVLKNLNDPEASPWYDANPSEYIYTPQWTFKPDQLRTW